MESTPQNYEENCHLQWKVNNKWQMKLISWSIKKKTLFNFLLLLSFLIFVYWLCVLYKQYHWWWFEHDYYTLQATEWHHLAEEFSGRVDEAVNLLLKLVTGPNKSFMCDMYSYLWDLVSILKICRAFVQWLGILRALCCLFESYFS